MTARTAIARIPSVRVGSPTVVWNGRRGSIVVGGRTLLGNTVPRRECSRHDARTQCPTVTNDVPQQPRSDARPIWVLRGALRSHRHGFLVEVPGWRSDTDGQLLKLARHDVDSAICGFDVAADEERSSGPRPRMSLPQFDGTHDINVPVSSSRLMKVIPAAVLVVGGG